MHPYRNSTPPASPPDLGALEDDRAVLWVPLLVSLLGLPPWLIGPTRWSAEPVIALLIALFCSSQLIREAWSRRRARGGRGQRGS